MIVYIMYFETKTKKRFNSYFLYRNEYIKLLFEIELNKNKLHIQNQFTPEVNIKSIFS